MGVEENHLRVLGSMRSLDPSPAATSAALPSPCWGSISGGVDILCPLEIKRAAAAILVRVTNEATPEWKPDQWKQGPKPAVPWWFNFDPYGWDSGFSLNLHFPGIDCAKLETGACIMERGWKAPFFARQARAWCQTSAT